MVIHGRIIQERSRRVFAILAVNAVAHHPLSMLINLQGRACSRNVAAVVVSRTDKLPARVDDFQAVVVRIVVTIITTIAMDSGNDKEPIYFF